MPRPVSCAKAAERLARVAFLSAATSAQRLLLGGARRSGSSGDRLGLQVSLLAKLPGQASDARERDGESLGDVAAGLPLLQGIDDALTKIQGDGFHDLSITESLYFREGL